MWGPPGGAGRADLYGAVVAVDLDVAQDLTPEVRQP